MFFSMYTDENSVSTLTVQSAGTLCNGSSVRVETSGELFSVATGKLVIVEIRYIFGLGLVHHNSVSAGLASAQDPSLC